MELKKLVVSCGGTGGHFYPGLSIAAGFRESGGEVLLLLSGANAEEQRKIAEKAGIRAVALPPMPHYRKNPFRFISGFIGGYSGAKRELEKFQPQALLGMGSFATLPVVLAAVRKKIPLFVHDGNARVGKANRFFSRWAKFAGSAFPAVNAAACRCQVVETGMPLRRELLKYSPLSRTDAIDKVNELFGTAFTADEPLILVTGGSQGAAVFNEIIPQAFCRLKRGFQVIHLTGKGKLAAAENGYKDAEFPRLLLETTSNMAEVMAAADLVFSRSGGSTAAELAFFGKAAVLVPYPYAAEGHQLDNARHFSNQGAAVLIENADLTVDRAVALLEDFLADREKFCRMSEQMKKLGRPDAANRMIQEISAALD